MITDALTFLWVAAHIAALIPLLLPDKPAPDPDPPEHLAWHDADDVALTALLQGPHDTK